MPDNALKSLKSIPTCLAKEDDDLVCYRFRCSTVAFARLEDIQAQSAPPEEQTNFWAELKEVFCPSGPRPIPVVHVPPGARLLVMDMPEDLREKLEVGRVEEVTLTQLAERNTLRDAVRFSNGREFLVRNLCAGQRVRVLSLSPETVSPGSHSVWRVGF